MTIFKAVGVSLHPSVAAAVERARAGDGATPAPAGTFDAMVNFIEIRDDAKRRVLSTETFTVVDMADLHRQVQAVLDKLKANHQAAQLAIDIAGKELAEVRV